MNHQNHTLLIGMGLLAASISTTVLGADAQQAAAAHHQASDKASPSLMLKNASAKQLPQQAGNLPPASPAKASPTNMHRGLQDAQQARELGAIKDANIGPAHMSERNTDITNPGGANLGASGSNPLEQYNKAKNNPGTGGYGSPHDDLTGRYSNLGNNSKSNAANALRPSANPKDWMSGAASSGNTTRATDEYGNSIHTTRSSDRDGNVTVRQDTYNRQGEFTSSTTSVYRTDGSATSRDLVRTGEIYDAESGESRVIVEEHRGTTDANGNTTSSSTLSRELGGGKNDPQGDIATTRDPNADNNDAATTCAAAPWLCRNVNLSIKNPNRETMRPDQDHGNTGFAPRINPGEDIATDPSIDQVRQAHGNLPQGMHPPTQVGPGARPPSPEMQDPSKN
jgi:hypothetical protein